MQILRGAERLEVELQRLAARAKGSETAGG
jgi:hypothetical protein